MNFLTELLGFNLMPHGYCLRWIPGLLWTHVVADSLIAIAYFSIPTSILYLLARQRAQAEFIDRYWWVGLMFAIFILSCGITHVFGIITIWKPMYGVQGLFKVVTAIVSVATALMLVKLVPVLLTLKSPKDLDREVAKGARIAEELEHTRAQLKSAQLARQRSDDRVRELSATLSHRPDAIDAGGRRVEQAIAADISAVVGRQILRELPRLAGSGEENSDAPLLSLDPKRVAHVYQLAEDVASNPVRLLRLREQVLHAVEDCRALWGHEWLDRSIDVAPDLDLVAGAGTLSTLLMAAISLTVEQAETTHLNITAVDTDTGSLLRISTTQSGAPSEPSGALVALRELGLPLARSIGATLERSQKAPVTTVQLQLPTP